VSAGWKNRAESMFSLFVINLYVSIRSLSRLFSCVVNCKALTQPLSLSS